LASAGDVRWEDRARRRVKFKFRERTCILKRADGRERGQPR